MTDPRGFLDEVVALGASIVANDVLTAYDPAEHDPATLITGWSSGFSAEIRTGSAPSLGVGLEFKASGSEYLVHAMKPSPYRLPGDLFVGLVLQGAVVRLFHAGMPVSPGPALASWSQPDARATLLGPGDAFRADPAEGLSQWVPSADAIVLVRPIRQSEFDVYLPGLAVERGASDEATLWASLELAEYPFDTKRHSTERSSWPALAGLAAQATRSSALRLQPILATLEQSDPVMGSALLNIAAYSKFEAHVARRLPKEAQLAASVAAAIGLYAESVNALQQTLVECVGSAAATSALSLLPELRLAADR